MGRLLDRGEPENIEGVGLDICMARTELGVRNAGRERTLLGVWGLGNGVIVRGSGRREYALDTVLGIREIGEGFSSTCSD